MPRGSAVTPASQAAVPRGPCGPGHPGRACKAELLSPGALTWFAALERGRTEGGRRASAWRTSGGVLVGVRVPLALPSPRGGSRRSSRTPAPRSLSLSPSQSERPRGAVRAGCPSAAAPPRPPTRGPRSRTCGAPCTYPRRGLGRGRPGSCRLGPSAEGSGPGRARGHSPRCGTRRGTQRAAGGGGRGRELPQQRRGQQDASGPDSRPADTRAARSPGPGGCG